jgi:hypothetical protein
MLVAEMAKADHLMNAIIIASNKSSVEFPGYLGLENIFPSTNGVPGN